MVEKAQPLESPHRADSLKRENFSQATFWNPQIFREAPRAAHCKKRKTNVTGGGLAGEPCDPLKITP